MPEEEKRRRVKIRDAKPYDITKICTLLEQAVYEGEGLYPEPDRYMAINWVTGILTTGYVIVAESGGRVVGSIAVTEFRFPWSPKPYLYVDWLYVAKAYRSGGTFEALMSVIETFADSKEVPIFGGIMSGKRAGLKDRLMERRGYQYLGGQFIRTIEGGNVAEEYPHMEVSENGQRQQEDLDDPD